ncbi:MAG: hypothetical protein J6V38_07720 [Kiritimatiellae bacterium]|nr:hypothetical protein [Kiritimatiellia bacterium]
MENITLADAWAWILAAAAAIVALSKAWDVIARKLKPQREISDRLKTIETMLASDKRRLDEQDKANGVIFRALYAQINHELSGNGDQILRDSRDEIQKYLTTR